MPEYLLDYSDVSPMGQEVSGARMSKHMGAHHIAKSDSLGSKLHSRPGALTRQSSASGIEEHRLSVSTALPFLWAQTTSSVGAQPAGQGGMGWSPNGYQALLGALAEYPKHPVVLTIDVVQR
jgi:hypothetical protein